MPSLMSVSTLVTRLIRHIEPLLAALFETHRIPDSHGLEHAHIVMEHGRRTLESVAADTSKVGIF